MEVSVVAARADIRDAASVASGRAANAETARERVLVTVLLAAGLGLRLAYLWHYRIDSDEPQHLHVAWGWAHGLVQYRDVFDNHAPLFHLLCAPFVAVLGERADIIVCMRMLMLPLYAATVVAACVIARALYSERIARWTGVLAGLAPGFFLTSIEFRADELWAALFLVAVAVAVRGRLSRARCFTTGLLLGTAFAVSMKSILLLIALAIAAITALTWVAPRRHIAWRVLGGQLAAVLAGLVVVPAVVVASFAVAGALDPLLYGTVWHNVVPGLGHWHSEPLRPLILVLAAPLLWLGASTVAADVDDIGRGARRAFVFVTGGASLALLLGWWPLETREDYLPIVPLLAVFVTALVVEPPWMTTDTAVVTPGAFLRSRALPLLAVAIEVAILLRTASPLHDETIQQRDLLAAVLRLTAPDDYVMDMKGETVFRRRATYYVFEHITKVRLARGLIPDDGVERLIAAHTTLVTNDRPSYPPRSRAFMAANYVSIGDVRVLGLWILPDSAPPACAPVEFDVAIPERYVLVGPRGAGGSLDGSSYRGGRYLAAGRHEYRPDPGCGPVALVWERAIERGFWPVPSEGTAG